MLTCVSRRKEMTACVCTSVKELQVCDKQQKIRRETEDLRYQSASNLLISSLLVQAKTLIAPKFNTFPTRKASSEELIKKFFYTIL